jgi:integrase
MHEIPNDYWYRLTDDQRVAVVKCLVERLGVPVAEVARAAGVSKASVSYWLSGQRVPQADKLQALFNAMPDTVAKCLPVPPVNEFDVYRALEIIAQAVRVPALRNIVAERLKAIFPGLKPEVAYSVSAEDIDLFKQKLAANGVSKATIDYYVRYLTRFLQHVGWILTPESMQKVYTYTESHKIQRETILALKRFVDLVVKVRDPAAAPILYDAVKTPPVKRSRNGFRLPTIEEVRRVWEEAHKISPCAAAVWGIMAETGVRFDHLHRASITGLQLDKRRLLLGETEGPKRQPLLFLTEGAARYLRDVYLPFREKFLRMVQMQTDRLFPCTEDKLYEYLKRAREAAGLPWLEPRLLRKFNAQYLLDQGVDISDIALLQGRALPSGLAITIEHYVADYEKRLRAVFERHAPRVFP